MKVIELLNKIVNREEVPKTIYYCNLEFEWTGLNYYCEKTDEFLDTHICLEDLEQEVEIIEEPQEHKIPEKLKIRHKENDTLVNEKILQEDINDELANKINEIIDYLEEIE